MFPLRYTQPEDAKRYPVHCAKSTNGRQKWKHYDGVSASTAAVKSRWPESQERIAEGVWLIGMASGRGRGAQTVCLVYLVCEAEGEKSATSGTWRDEAGLSGLCGFFGSMNETNQRNQINKTDGREP
jgi:hypothetical protein